MPAATNAGDGSGTSDKPRMTNSAPTLIDRIQALPQELIDMIKDEVFKTAHWNQAVIRIRTERQYRTILKAPDSLALLRTSKATRAQFLSSYYSSTFILHHLIPMQHWMRNTEPKHRDLIGGIRFVCSTQDRSELDFFKSLLQTFVTRYNYRGKLMMNDEASWSPS